MNRTGQLAVLSGRTAGPIAASCLALALSLAMGACSGNLNKTPPATYTLTVNSTNPASGVTIGVTYPPTSLATQNATSFTLSGAAGSMYGLSAPATAGGNQFSSWSSGCTSVVNQMCNVTLNSDTTVTVNYATPAKTTPTVTVTPGVASIMTTQSLSVTIAVSGTPTPTGSVTLASGAYTSTAATLTNGSITITIPANSLAVGTDTLTATYTPDTNSSSTYNSATGTGSVTVTPSPTYTLTVDSANPASGVVIAAVPTDNNLKTGGTTSFTLTYNAGVAVTLSANAFSGSNPFSSWSGCTSATNETCNVTLNGNTTVTANFSTPAKVTPTVTVSPATGSIASTQPLPVTVTVAGGSGNPTPTGSVTLASGAYSSAAATLAGGSATITIPANSLAAGTDTLTATYTPDTAGSATYLGATGTGSVTVTASSTYTLTVDSAAPSSGIGITASPADNSSKSSGSTPFPLTYNSGTLVTLSAPLSIAGGYSFVSWSGCTPVSGTPSNCTVTMNANTAVTATYNEPSVTSITIACTTVSTSASCNNTSTTGAVVIGTQAQFTATVNGTGSISKSVTWSMSCPSCGSASPGDFASTTATTALYNTPYPAPATVVITATSVFTPSVSASMTVTLSLAPGANGPALTVNAGNQTHAISPFIYGMNAYSLSQEAAKAVNLPVDRWGGDATSRYNYQLDVTNAGNDWYFENGVQATGQEATSGFNAQVESDASVGAKTLGTVPVLGWVASNGTACGFPTSTYANQVSWDPYRPANASCGDGLYSDGVNGCTSSGGCNITGNNPNLTDQTEGPSWAGGWVTYLVGQFGTAANGGVAIYDLDNEPAWWDAVHRDVHPAPSTYDEVTNNGIATAKAIKTSDPTAEVSGPVIDYWWNYFYSKKDIESGWDSGGPCYQPWSNPTDRAAHGGTAFIEYYLQQFAAASTTFNARLLDYLDMHTYFAGQYNGSSVGLTTAGDTQEQEVRLNSTRVLWDPTYTDPNYAQPNYSTNPGSQSCNVPLQAPQLIPMAKSWVNVDYPGTKVAFTEYNWGGQENINGAVAQADILGIFGQYGLDLATLWGPPDPTTQIPGLMAFEIYRNYDGKNSMFGDTALSSSSANQGQLSVYGAERSADGSVTVMVINKTYGPLTSTLSLQNFTTASTTAQVFLYSNANLNAIVPQSAATITPPSGSGTTSTVTATFPAQSITLLVIPN
jgi:hypothetical protein